MTEYNIKKDLREMYDLGVKHTISLLKTRIECGESVEIAMENTLRNLNKESE